MRKKTRDERRAKQARLDALDRAASAAFRKAEARKKEPVEADDGGRNCFAGKEPMRKRMIARQKELREGVRMDEAEFTQEELETPTSAILRDPERRARWIKAKLALYQKELEQSGVPNWQFAERLKKEERRLWDETAEASIRMDAGGRDATSARRRMTQRQNGAADRDRERYDAMERVRDPSEGWDSIKKQRQRDVDKMAASEAKARQRLRASEVALDCKDNKFIAEEDAYLNAEAEKLSCVELSKKDKALLARARALLELDK